MGGRGGGKIPTVPCNRTITIRHLLTHTSGISYGFDTAGALIKVDRMYAKGGLYRKNSQRAQWYGSLESFVDRLAGFPLCFQPGDEWLYGFNTDVLGRVVEVVSGLNLAKYFDRNIFQPLGMTDTGFFVRPKDAPRLTTVVKRAWQPLGMMALGASRGLETREFCVLDQIAGDATSKHSPRSFERAFLEGGSGLVSTAGDYMRFVQMLLNGGKLRETRILGSATVHYMVQNHLKNPAGGPCDMRTKGTGVPGYTESSPAGTGFGLGVAVVVDPTGKPSTCSAGNFLWGGAASTYFWCDPKNDLAVVFMTALLYRDDFALPLRDQLENVVYAHVDDLGGAEPTVVSTDRPCCQRLPSRL